MKPGRSGVRPTRMTRVGVVLILATIAVSAAFLLWRYQALPDLLPVHFRRDLRPNGWQYKTYWRVMLPVFVQVALALVLGTVSALLLSRPDVSQDENAAEIRAAAVAAETVVFLTLIWVAFQAYAGFALVEMWQLGRGGLSRVYTPVLLSGIVLTGVVAIRAMVKLGRPEPRPFVPEHWRFGQLYHNPADPALFVPTRDGSRWTLNFGRPVAAALMGLALGIGIVVPTVILGLLLR